MVFKISRRGVGGWTVWRDNEIDSSGIMHRMSPRLMGRNLVAGWQRTATPSDLRYIIRISSLLRKQP